MTFAEYIASRPDLANNWANAFSPEYEFDETAQSIRGFASFEDYVANDYGRPFDVYRVGMDDEERRLADLAAAIAQRGAAGAGTTTGPIEFPDLDPPLPEAPPEPNEPQTGVRTLSAPGAVASPILNLSPATPAPVLSPSTATTMTAAQYLADRPDLAANWDRAFQSGFADDPTAEWIRSFGSLEAYLRHDYGRAFDATTSGANPPPNANAGGTNATTNTTSGTANTGGSNTTLVSANDASILGGIDQFLRSASGILGALTGRTNQNTTTTTTTTPPAENQTKTLLLIGGAALVAFAIARSMA